MSKISNNKIIIGIYQIKNIINNKIYIGSSKDIFRRWKEHKGLLNNKKHHSYRLQIDWNEYGESNFEFSILEVVSDINKLLEIEQTWLDKYKSYEKSNGYNISAKTIYPAIDSSEKIKDMFNWRNDFKIHFKTINDGINMVTNETLDDKSFISNEGVFLKLVLTVRNIYNILFNNIDDIVEYIDVEPKLYIKNLNYSMYELCLKPNKECVDILTEFVFEMISFENSRYGYDIDIYNDSIKGFEIEYDDNFLYLIIDTYYKKYEIPICFKTKSNSDLISKIYIYE